MNIYKDENNSNVLYFLLTVIIFVTPLIGSLILLVKVIRANKRFDYILLAFSLAMIAFYWDPTLRGPLYDLVRHHVKYNIVSEYSFFEFIKTLTLFKPIQDIIIWILSFFGNKNLLQFVVTFTTTGLLFEIIRVVSLKYNIKERFLLIALLFSSLRFIMVISNLWSDLAVVIMCYGVLIAKEKKVKYFLYILSIGIHFFLVIPLALMFIINFVKKTKRNLLAILILLIFSPVIISTSLVILSEITNLRIVEIILHRYNAYLSTSSEPISIYNFRYFLLEITKPIFIFGVILFAKKLNLTKNVLARENIIQYPNGLWESLIVSVFTIALGLKFNVLFRFTFMAILLFSPYMIPLIKSTYDSLRNENIKYSFIYKISIQVFVLIQLIYQLNGLYHAYLFSELFHVLF